jgi:phasin family protein
MMQFDNVQKIGAEGVEAAVKSLGVLSKGAQTVAAETAEFAKRSFEQSTATMEKLAGVRTLDKAMAIQSDYVRTSYENLVAQASKLGDLVTTTAREAYAPVEALVSKRPQTVA